MRASDRRGISVLEALVALTVVSLVTVSSMTVLSQQFDAAYRAQRALEAEALSTMRMDIMGLLTDAELLQLPDTVEKGVFEYPMDEYSWLVTSEPTNQSGLYHVTLSVLWTDNAYTVNTFMYRRPVVRTVSQ